MKNKKPKLTAVLSVTLIICLLLTAITPAFADGTGESTGAPIMDAIFSDDNSTKSSWDAVVNNVKTWTHEAGSDSVTINHNRIAGWQLTKQTYNNIAMTVKVDEPTPKNPYNSTCTRSFLFGASSGGNYPTGYALTIYKYQTESATDNWIQLHYLNASLSGTFLGGYVGDFTDKEVSFTVINGDFTLILNGSPVQMVNSSMSGNVPSVHLDNYGEGGSIGILSWDSGSTTDAKMSITAFEEIVIDPDSTGAPIMDAIFSDDNSTKSSWNAVVNNVKSWTHYQGTDYAVVNHNKVAGWQLTKQTYKNIEMTVKVDEPTPNNPYNSACTRSFLFGASNGGNYPTGYALTIYKYQTESATDNWIQLHYLNASLNGTFLGGYVGDFTDKEVSFRVVNGDFTLILNGNPVQMVNSSLSGNVPYIHLDNYGDGGSIGILSWNSASAHDAKMSITAFRELPGYDPALKVTAASVRLQSSLAMNFKTGADFSAYQSVYAIAEFNGTEYRIDSYKTEGDIKTFVFRNIAPDKMGDVIRITLYGEKNDSETYAGDPVEINVADYCVYLMNTREDPALRTLLADLVNYGAQAQMYTGYKTDSVVSGRLSAEQSAYASTELAPLDDDYAVISKADNADVGITGVSLVLGDSVTIRYNVDAESFNGVTFKVTDGEKYSILSPYSDGNGVYHVDFKGVTADRMRTAFRITAYDDNGNAISDTVAYSVATYANGMLSDAAVGPLVRAMMLYGDSAAAYAASAD